MAYGGPQDYPPYYENQNQHNNHGSQQVDQAGEFGEENNGQSIAELVKNEEEERIKQEELMKKKKQEEIESKFDSLKYLL